MAFVNRGRRAASVAALVIASLTVAACASGPESPTPSSSAVYAKAVAALTSASSVEFTGSTAQASEPSLTFDVRFDGGNSTATLRTGAEVISVRVVNGTRFIQENSAVWDDLGLSAYAGQYANRWLAFPPGPPAILGGDTTVLSSLLEWGARDGATRTVFGGFIPTAPTITATVKGVTCFELVTPDQRLYVEKSDYRPVLYVAGPDGTATTRFSYPANATAVLAPPSPSTLPPAPHLAG